ncbi:MAG: helix-turn-helix transcriptional regulator [Candidatus Bathyarchaeota archaeon]|nr:helix-turn-helix transcriptional regulator [Candidatus Bathyarchaeum tardum]WGM88794.1 MAG: helix-turn-helix transcriptional regulator [Candidatus Bathyarchaeum tardum]WNZ28959.1 MAG: helix-turn-helix transcriptional regulator [Candidatus Bathyarchaeota archaeon]
MHPGHDEKTASKWLKESQKGYMRIAFLLLLNRKPCYGYEMMKEVEDRTEGFWKPTAGGVYPILQSLEEAGYIEGKWGPQKRKRKIYHITEAGKRILDRALLKHSRIAESMNSLFEEYVRSVLAVEPNGLPIPQFPNFFSPFLEKESKTRKEALEMKRKRIQNMVNMLQEELKNVDKRLVALNKEKQNLNHQECVSVEEQETDLEA